MKKILSASLVSALLLPAFVFAAYNDVSLDSGTAVLSVNSITINVTGNDAVLESMEIGASSFSVTMAAGSAVEITAPDENQMAIELTTGDAASYQSQSVCNATLSSVVLSASGAVTITITPSSTTCGTTTGGGGGGGGGSGSSGGGGGGGVSAPASIPIATSTASASAAPAAPVSPTAITGLLAQLTALMSQIKALGGTVSPSLEATISSLAGLGASASATGAGTFTRDLQTGMTGEDVKALQKFLNSHGYSVAKSGLGSAGNETTKFGAGTRAALAKFQVANKIVPAAGYFGPKTRALVNSMK